MLLINKLTKPGGIKLIELRLDTVQVIFTDGTKRIYTNNELRFRDQADYGCLDAQVDAGRDSP